MVHPRVANQLVAMITRLADLGCTYAKCRLDNPPNLFISIFDLLGLSTWNT